MRVKRWKLLKQMIFELANFMGVETLLEPEDTALYIVLAKWVPLDRGQKIKTLVYWQSNVLDPEWIFSDDFATFETWAQLASLFESQRVEADGGAYLLEDTMRARATAMFAGESARYYDISTGFLKTLRRQDFTQKILKIEGPESRPEIKDGSARPSKKSRGGWFTAAPMGIM